MGGGGGGSGRLYINYVGELFTKCPTKKLSEAHFHTRLIVMEEATRKLNLAHPDPEFTSLQLYLLLLTVLLGSGAAVLYDAMVVDEGEKLRWIDTAGWGSC